MLNQTLLFVNGVKLKNTERTQLHIYSKTRLKFETPKIPCIGHFIRLNWKLENYMSFMN